MGGAAARLKERIVSESLEEGDTKMTKPIVPAADELIGVKVPVLDKGSVVLVDYMGDDNAIVQAARVSYGMGTKKVSDDRGLIRYLMRHRHTTPFEMIELKFRAKMPIFVARQWARHRTVSLNEISARYSILIDDYYIPERGVVQAQSKTNRQGRGDALPQEIVEHYRQSLAESCKGAYELYAQYLENGIAREIARLVLPVDFYTEWYWKINLHNLFHFLGLRLDAHAQYEIRVYAEAMWKIAKAVAPIACEAFEDFTLNSISLSKKEVAAVSALLREDTPVEIAEVCEKAGLRLRKEDGTPLKTGEGPEFLQKLETLKVGYAATA